MTESRVGMHSNLGALYNAYSSIALKIRKLVKLPTRIKNLRFVALGRIHQVRRCASERSIVLVPSKGPGLPPLTGLGIWVVLERSVFGACACAV